MERWWKVSNLETVPTRKYPIPGLPYLTLPILPYPTLPDLLDYHHPLYSLSLSLCLSPSLFHILGQPTHPPSHPHTLTIITHTHPRSSRQHHHVSGRKRPGTVRPSNLGAARPQRRTLRSSLYHALQASPGSVHTGPSRSNMAASSGSGKRRAVQAVVVFPARCHVEREGNPLSHSEPGWSPFYSR